MAITLTAGELAIAMRLTATLATDPITTVDQMVVAAFAALPPGQQDVITRLLLAATEVVKVYGPTAPDAVHNEAVVRLASFLYDMGGTDRQSQNPLQQSGAAALLSRWREVRLQFPD